MGKHRLIDNEENSTCESHGQRKRKMLSFLGDKEVEGDNVRTNRVNREGESNWKEEREMEDGWPKPLGESIEVSDDGEGPMNHYGAFEYVGVRYQLEDYVFLEPEHENEKPYVAIIKAITKTPEEPLMIGVQWFYRPEDVDGSGTHRSYHTRELFYSFHTDEVAAESVKHKCDVYFIPLHKNNPNCKKIHTFIVRGVYDHEQKKLYTLTDKVYRDGKQKEIDILVQKTQEQLGELCDVELQDTALTDLIQVKCPHSRKRNMLPLEASLDGVISSECYRLLSRYGLLTKDTRRAKCLEKLLQSLEFICTVMDNQQNAQESGGSDFTSASHKNGDSNQINKSPIDWQVEQENGVSDVRSPTASNKNCASNPLDKSPHKTQNGEVSVDWSEKAAYAVADLEKAMHKALFADKQKYNQKMRQLEFNIKIMMY